MTIPSHLTVDNDRGADPRAHQGGQDGVVIPLQRGGGVTDGDPQVDQLGILLLQLLHHGAQSDDLLSLHGVFLLVHVHILQLTVGVLDPAIDHPQEFFLIHLQVLRGDIPELSVLSDLVGWPGAHRVTVNIDYWLLPHVQPDDLAVLGVQSPSHLLQTSLESGDGGLTTAVNLVTWHPPEVGDPIHLVRKLLYLLKVVGHDHGLPHLGVGVLCLLRGHDGGCEVGGQGDTVRTASRLNTFILREVRLEWTGRQGEGRILA